jgi:hypothetical protein
MASSTRRSERGSWATEEDHVDERATYAPGAEHLPPAGANEPGTGGAGDSPFDDPRVLQILSTEHWSLLSQRSLVYNESFARAGMFLTFLSASLVALAFAASAMAFDRTFLVLATTLLSVDLVIGLATVGRMLDTSLDDVRAIAGMNRIRNAYVQIAPVVQPFLITSIHDDAAGALETYGEKMIRPGIGALLHGPTTASGMIGVIDSVLAAALAGVLAVLVGLSPGIVLATAAIVFIVAFAAITRYAISTVVDFQEHVVSRFPTPPVART